MTHVFSAVKLLPDNNSPVGFGDAGVLAWRQTLSHMLPWKANNAYLTSKQLSTAVCPCISAVPAQNSRQIILLQAYIYEWFDLIQLNQLFSLLPGITVLIQELNSLL